MNTPLTGSIHLNDRWSECAHTPPDSTSWPPDGFVASIIADPGSSPEAGGVAVTLASYAVEGLREIPVSTVVGGSIERQAAVMAGLRELAGLGHITLVGAP